MKSNIIIRYFAWIARCVWEAREILVSFSAIIIVSFGGVYIHERWGPTGVGYALLVLAFILLLSVSIYLFRAHERRQITEVKDKLR